MATQAAGMARVRREELAVSFIMAIAGSLPSMRKRSRPPPERPADAHPSAQRHPPSDKMSETHTASHAALDTHEVTTFSLDVHFVSPAPVSSPGSAGLQPGSRSHAGAWRSQGKPWRTSSGCMKQTSSAAHRNGPRQCGGGTASAAQTRSPQA